MPIYVVHLMHKQVTLKIILIYPPDMHILPYYADKCHVLA